MRAPSVVASGPSPSAELAAISAGATIGVMRTSLALALVLLPAVGCGPLFAVVPPNRAPQVAATGYGVTLTALGEQWRGAPGDLADRVTPIQVVLQNHGPQSIAISLADFELFDDENDGGVALNPFLVPIADNTSPELLDLKQAPKLAFRGWGGGRGWGGRGVGARSFGVRRYVPGPRRVWRSPTIVVRPAPWRFHPGFHVSGGLRRFYGPGAIYWGGPWYGPVRAGVAWEGAYSAPEVLQYALPEGVLQPGAEVRGFVYFDRLTSDRTRGLRLRYRPRDAATGAVAPQLEIRLEVVRN